MMKRGHPTTVGASAYYPRFLLPDTGQASAKALSDHSHSINRSSPIPCDPFSSTNLPANGDACNAAAASSHVANRRTRSSPHPIARHAAENSVPTSHNCSTSPASACSTAARCSAALHAPSSSISPNTATLPPADSSPRKLASDAAYSTDWRCNNRRRAYCGPSTAAASDCCRAGMRPRRRGYAPRPRRNNGLRPSPPLRSGG